jgi:NADH/NAD ratio-sensing transcriptional regulator Rex
LHFRKNAFIFIVKIKCEILNNKMNNLIQTKRLQRYRMALLRLKKMGLKKTFSHSLSEETGVSPELIRKDFSQYGIKGKRRGGYDIDHLIEELKLLFGRKRSRM